MTVISSDVETVKKQLRKQMLSVRDAMLPEERAKKSNCIAKRFLRSELYQNCDRIFCYVSFRSEVDTKELIMHMISDGKKVAVPRVDGKNMHFYEITGLLDCREGQFGILEPIEGLEEAVPDCIFNSKNSDNKSSDTGSIIATNRDLMIVPGSAFTLQRDRIGYGGGYYDRFLENYPLKTIGFFFDCQKADVIPCNQYDKKLSYILTETVFLS